MTIMGGEAALAKRVILVTGAGKGIGRAIAEYLARRGARIVVNNRDRDGADSAGAVCAAIAAQGGEAVADRSDVRDPGAGAAMVGAAVAKWGRLDGVVLNAGVSGPASRFPDLSDAAIRDVIETNFFANLSIARAALPHLLASESGRLLAIASSAGLYGVRGRSAYAASKAALIAWSLSLSLELAREQVRVNVLAPYAATQMTADAMAKNPTLLQRMAPERVASVAAWLLNPECQSNGRIWVTGGGVLRRAAMLEAGGVRLPEHQPEAWLGAHASELEDMAGATSFDGAEAAFADFLRL